MITIKNNEDCRLGYQILITWANNPDKTNTRENRVTIAEIKRDIRRWTHRNTNPDRHVIISDDTYGVFCVEHLPDDIQSMSEAEQFFDEYKLLKYYPSPYDCTGQAFTNWFKIFKRNGKYYAYHKMNFDV